MRCYYIIEKITNEPSDSYLIIIKNCFTFILYKEYMISYLIELNMKNIFKGNPNEGLGYPVSRFLGIRQKKMNGELAVIHLNYMHYTRNTPRLKVGNIPLYL